MTNKRHTVFYVSVTNNLRVRIEQHKQRLIPGFTYRYNIDQLIYYETYQDPITATEREKQIKGWRREKKFRLVRKQNPDLKNLSDEL